MKYFRLFFLPILVVGLIGCVVVEEKANQPTEETIVVEEDTPVVESNVVEKEVVVDTKSVYEDPVAFKAFIEDNSNYKILDDPEEKRGLTRKSERCSHLDNFLDKTFNGDIAYLDLGEKVAGMRIYASPNYEAWSTLDVEKEFMYFADGLGVIEPMKAYPDHLLWGFPNCGGAEEPKESPSYDRYQECLKVTELMKGYLENEPDYVTGTEARAEYQQDENYRDRCAY